MLARDSPSAQSGVPFARTFVGPLNFGTATIKAEPVGSRSDTVVLVDVREEKACRLSGVRIAGFVDLYNLLNTNGEQNVTTISGVSWLKPTTISGQRILRVGARLEW
jgi:hypothetical protein